MKSIYYTSALSLILVACNSSEVAQKESKNKQDVAEETSVIKPLSFDPGATVYRVSANASDTIFTPSGSSIIFGPNSFVDANGKPVKGEVDVEWQEFHSLGDIVASGIPMKYDSAGVAYDLESGGMFTIDAKKDGEPVEMAPGKTAQVNLASLQDTPCYNFYKLDEKSGQWDYKTTKNGKEIGSDTPESTGKVEPTIFDIQLSTANFPELASKDIIGWKCEDNLKPAERVWLKQSNTKVRLVEKSADGVYLLEAKDGSGSKKYKVTPYERKEAVADSKINRRELDAQADEVIEYARKMAEGTVIRSIEISGFGTYNWDIINKRENSLPLFAKFEYPQGTNASLVTLRLISPDENVVVMYDPVDAPRFSFDPEKRNVLIGILPNNEIVAASNSDFDAARNKQKGAQHTFVLKKTGIKLKSPKDITTHLNKLI